MKLTVNIDCTPEEARSFLGLPDLSSVHEVYVERLRTATAEGVTPEVVMKFFQTWGPLSETSLKAWASVMDRAAK